MVGRLTRVWLLVPFAIAMIVVVPLGVVFTIAVGDASEAWDHIVETRLLDYALSTLGLAVLVGILALAFGVPTAWLVQTHRFPGRSMLSWALMLPLAVPVYVAAYALTDLFQFSGPVQGWMREHTGWSRADYWFPDLRTLPGAALILASTLYPYVYLSARVAFASLPRSAMEASRTLGSGPIRTFFCVALPLSRPAIVAGLALVIMETLADFGAVQHCAVDTFATGIYRAWYGMDSQAAAARLSVLLVLGIATILVTEWALRTRRAHHHNTHRSAPMTPRTLRGIGGWITCATCCIPLFVGFALPGARLLYLAIDRGDRKLASVFDYGLKSLMLGAGSAVIAVVLATCMVATHRASAGHSMGVFKAITRYGYALPGPVVAIGVITALGWGDRTLNDLWASIPGERARLGLVLSGSIMALLVGYQTRFLGVAIPLIDAAYGRINHRLDDAARTLGANPAGVFAHVHLPNLRAPIFATGLFVFVDVAKELPATLMLRPFNYDTLAVRVYQLASEERLDEAATGALFIVAIGMLPALVLARRLSSEHRTLGVVLHNEEVSA